MSLSTIRVKDVLRIVDKAMENATGTSWVDYHAPISTGDITGLKLTANQARFGDITISSIYCCESDHGFYDNCNQCKNVTVTYEEVKGITSISVNKVFISDRCSLMDKTLAEILN